VKQNPSASVLKLSGRCQSENDPLTLDGAALKTPELSLHGVNPPDGRNE